MPLIDRVSRQVAASPEAVFEAFLDEAALANWLPPEGMTGSLTDADLREGGGFTMTLTYDDPPAAGGKTTADSDVTTVAILEVRPARAVVWGVDFESDDPDFAGQMRMTWSFTESGDGTSVAVDLTHVPVGIDAEVHAQGIRASLANLAAYLASHAED